MEKIILIEKVNTLAAATYIHGNVFQKNNDFVYNFANDEVKQCINIDILNCLIQSLEDYQLKNFLRYVKVHFSKFKAIYKECDILDQDVLFVIIFIIYFC